MKRLTLLGATGSIGTQTVDVVRQHPDQFAITALSAGKNMKLLKRLLAAVHVKAVCVREEADAAALSKEYPELTVYCGDEGLTELAGRRDYDLLVNALVGFVGFAPTLKAIESGHDVALANKETLVCGGELINKALKEKGCKIYPIDSEHSAIAQCLQKADMKSVRRLLITCSGGAFRDKTKEELGKVTLADALAHPTWQMGAKITVDCANLMNKGFEVIEAHWLFGVDYDNIQVLMHPESVVHSAVEFIDHSVIAQLCLPDMRLPIQYALSAGNRLTLDLNGELDLNKIGALHFYAPDFARHPLLGLAYEAGRKGGNLPAVMNGANETANAAFRKGRAPFTLIEKAVIEAVRHAAYKPLETAGDLIEADAWGRDFANDYIRSHNG